MNLFSQLFENPAEFLLDKLISLPVILIALTVHEVCHAFVAYKCGDPTARATGRMTFNPLKHLDPIGFAFLLLFGFGFAKPVLINPNNFKNRRRDTALVSLAGPLSNLLLAFLASLVYVLYAIFGYGQLLSSGSVLIRNMADVINLFLVYSCSINLGLFIFNLIPIPPLDGSKVLFSILPPRVAYQIQRYEQYFHIALFVLLFAGAFSNLIGDGIYWIFHRFIDLWSLVFGGLL